ncbi:MAG: hypothetical protein ACRC14_06090 [Paracoccaceae bacterium]
MRVWTDRQRAGLRRAMALLQVTGQDRGLQGQWWLEPQARPKLRAEQARSVVERPVRSARGQARKRQFGQDRLLPAFPPLAPRLALFRAWAAGVMPYQRLEPLEPLVP